jgi:hypothetical protein
LLAKLETIDIITIKLDETEVLVSSTTIEDQNNFSYYSSDSVLDKRLYPDEKMDMMFELINSNKIDE